MGQTTFSSDLSHPALNATVWAWIKHIIKAGGQTIIGQP
jgi:hypothetical protein